MQLRLSLSSDSQSDESLQELTCEFCAALQREAGVIAARPEGPCSPGSKGDPITLGTLLLQFVAPAAITGLANVMRAYCERDSSLTFEFERPDGEKVVVTGKNVRREDLEKVIRMTETSAQFADGGGSKRYAVLIASSTFPKEPSEAAGVSGAGRGRIECGAAGVRRLRFYQGAEEPRALRGSPANQRDAEARAKG